MAYAFKVDRLLSQLSQEIDPFLPKPDVPLTSLTPIENLLFSISLRPGLVSTSK
jgi:hypothetical protein